MIRRAITAAGDYAPLVDGGWAEDQGQLPNVILALRTRKGSCLVAPEFGNRSGLVPERITPTTPRVIENDYRDALRHLTTSGLIWDLTIESTLIGGASPQTTVSFRDAAGPRTLTI